MRHGLRAKGRKVVSCFWRSERWRVCPDRGVAATDPARGEETQNSKQAHKGAAPVRVTVRQP
jgi:hypothetical protein